MPILDDRHDFAHPVEGDTAWWESYYFNAYCPVADAGLFTRIGVRPNEGTMDVGLSVWLPGIGARAHASRYASSARWSTPASTWAACATSGSSR